MNLKEYAEKIQELSKKYPDSQVVYSRDEEGNGFAKVYNNPSIGFYDEKEYCFYCEEEIKEQIENAVDENIKINSVCIN